MCFQSPKRRLLGLCLVVAALVWAQDVFPEQPAFHDWPYAAALAACVVALLRGRRACVGIGADQARGGALIVAVAGLASGLLGAPPQAISRSPGTVAPLPNLGLAAFFPETTPALLAGRPPSLLFRQRGGAAFMLAPGERRLLGGYHLAVRLRPAALIEVRDRRGARLTMTQPTGAFLSPVLLFPQVLTVDGRTFPADSFALPALRLQVRALFFSPDSRSRRATLGGAAMRPGVLISVDDERGNPVPGGVILVPGGSSVNVHGIHFFAAVGRYPEIVVSSVPVLAALGLGSLLFVVGVFFLLRRADEARGEGNG